MFGGVKRQYWYCSGESVLKQSQFNEDVANQRMRDRVNTDFLMQFNHQLQKDAQPQQPQGLLQNAARTVARFVRQLARPVIRFFNTLQTITRNLGRMLAKATANLAKGFQAAGKMAEQAVKNILTFFFGHKKDNAKTEEKEQREQFEFTESDLFDDNKVHEGDGPSLAGGHK